MLTRLFPVVSNLLFLLSIGVTIPIYAQPKIVWQKCLGGSSYEASDDMAKTSDDGYIIGGQTGSNDGDVSCYHGGTDIWIAKTSSTGSIEWQKSIGGTGQEWIFSIVHTFDKGFAFTGYTYSSDGDITQNPNGHNGLIMKLDSAGNIQWHRCFGSDMKFQLCTQGTSIIQTKDSGFAVAGQVYGSYEGLTNHGFWDAYVARFSSTGTLLWEHAYGGNGNDHAYSIIETSDGGLAFAATTFSNNNGDISGYHREDTAFEDNTNISDIWLVKLTSTGNLQWQKCLGGTKGDAVSYGNRLLQTFDDGFVIGGGSASNDGDVSGNHGQSDFWIVKTDSLGKILWQGCYGGSGLENIRSTSQTLDSGFIIGGYTQSLNNGDISGFHHSGTRGDSTIDAWIIKLDQKGILEWQKCLGGTGDEYVSTILQTDEGGYTLVGYTRSNDGDVSGLHDQLGDCWLVNLTSSSSVNEQRPLKFDPINHRIYPNPGYDMVHFQLYETQMVKTVKVFNVFGVESHPAYNAFQNEINLDVASLSTGAYSAVITFTYNENESTYAVPFLVSH